MWKYIMCVEKKLYKLILGICEGVLFEYSNILGLDEFVNVNIIIFLERNGDIRFLCFCEDKVIIIVFFVL